jgi:hypothetical protein
MNITGVPLLARARKSLWSLTAAQSPINGDGAGHAPGIGHAHS